MELRGHRTKGMQPQLVGLAGDAAGTGQPLGEHDGDPHSGAAVVA